MPVEISPDQPLVAPAGQDDGPLKPLFRWAGGKRWLVPTISRLASGQKGRYFEPFLGGGAVYFGLRPRLASLSDSNTELIGCYVAIRDERAAVAEHLRSWASDEGTYYDVRALTPADRPQAAARLVFLTAHAFNGIYRVNRRGEFNVPYGGRPYLKLGDDDLLGAYSTALRGTELRACDFEDGVEEANDGDFVYLDPPYTVAHSNNGFVKYNSRIFSWDDQERLARVVRALDARGCRFVVSNADHDSIRDLYRGFRLLTANRVSVMAASADYRRTVSELLVTNVE